MTNPALYLGSRLSPPRSRYQGWIQCASTLLGKKPAGGLGREPEGLEACWGGMRAWPQWEGSRARWEYRDCGSLGGARQGLQGVLKSELASKGVSCLQKPTCLDFLPVSCLGQRESRVRWGPGTHPAVGVRVQLPPGSLGTWSITLPVFGNLYIRSRHYRTYSSNFLQNGRLR